MNYRHAFHAGNLCDVVKHAVFAQLLCYLNLKDKPYRVLDSHAGLGRYDLAGREATRTKEALVGIKVLEKAKLTPALAAFLKPYLDVQNACKTRHGKDSYAGSGQIAADLSRPFDKVLLNEMHPTDAVTLTEQFTYANTVKVMSRDGYEMVKASLPFTEKRGVVLIDPPFEDEGEEAKLIETLAMIAKKAPSTLVCIWYPIKELSRLNNLMKGARELKLDKLYSLTFMFEPLDDERLTGTGLLLLNPPFTLETQINAVKQDWLAALKLPQGQVRFDKL
jgi:23S rRNA (adenine2030-N6)-methyltransferase